MTPRLHERAPIGNYDIDAKIGMGGMGVVYKATHRLLGRPVAIKVLLPQFSESPGVVKRFFNEAKATTKVSHPGIVQIFDYGHEPGSPAYIVMELLTGESLKARLARLGRLEMDNALDIVRQVANALASAHAAGIVHRDLKPENIFLVPDDEVVGGERIKILDFGIAKLLVEEDAPRTTLTRKGTLLGTPMYMAPEQCLGDEDIDHRADIYSLGCVLYHLLTGRPPFVCSLPIQTIAAHISTEAEAPSVFRPGLSAAIDALVLRALSKDRDQRFATMAGFGNELARLLGRPAMAVEPAVIDIRATIPETPRFTTDMRYMATVALDKVADEPAPGPALPATLARVPGGRDEPVDHQEAHPAGDAPPASFLTRTLGSRLGLAIACLLAVLLGMMTYAAATG